MKAKYLLLFLIFSNYTFSQTNLKVGSKANKIYVSDWLFNTPNDKVLDGKYIVLLFWSVTNTTQYIGGKKINYLEKFNQFQEKFQRNDLYFISMAENNPGEVKKYLKENIFKTIAVIDITRRTQIGFGNKDGSIFNPLVILIDNKGDMKWISTPCSLTEKVLNDFLNNTLEPSSMFDTPKR
jgi:hypothetical protein